jgi:hypothetical protein
VPELATPDNYQGSEPTLIIWNAPHNALNDNPIVLFETAQASIYRFRYISFVGTMATSAGTASITFNLLTTGDTPAGWPREGPTAATVPHSFANNEGFLVVWSTDIADNYLGTSADWGTNAVNGFPLVYVPGGVQATLVASPSLGNTATMAIQSGMIQYEQFPVSALQTGGDTGEQRVYLLQSVKSGDAGAFA